MTGPCTSVRLPPVATGHPAARRYLLARRNALAREDLVIGACGLWAHEQLMRLGASVEAFLWCPGDSARIPGGTAGDRLRAVVERAAATADASYRISERTLARLHPGAAAPGLLSLVRIPRWDPATVLGGQTRLVLVADGIEYAGNLGTLMRTVDASGADALVLTGPVARRTHPTVFSASRGTVLTTPTLEYGDATRGRQALTTAGFRILVADPGVGADYRSARYDAGRTAIVVGSEGSGVSPQWRAGGTERVAISMRGRADSLNVAAAAAVLLFEALRAVDG
jgi:tRNA G18 (ribose-2'-O)-methylase SpoU